MPLSPLANQPRSDLLVMFGASGDLAKKKLFPAVYRLEKRGLLGVPVIGVALDDWTDDDLRDHARAAIEEEGEPWDQAAFERLAANLHYVAGDYGDHTTFEKLRDLAGGAAHPIFHLAIPPFLFGAVANGIAAVGPRRGRPPHHREAVRPRPPVGGRAERHAPRPLPGVGDLPHRPLHRQGGHAEPARHPVRQRHHRAALEPQRRVGGEDHHGRVVRRRGPRRVLRLRRRHARRHAEPPAADGRHPRHGAAGQRGLQGAARREGQGPRGRPRRSIPSTSCGASTTATSTCPA